MRKNLLLPPVFRKIGWALLIPSLPLGIYLLHNDCNTSGLAGAIGRIIRAGSEVRVEAIGNGIEPWLNNLLIVALLLGPLFIACSRERVEDEMIGRIRLNALLTALYANTAIVIVAALTLYGLAFLDLMICNLFTLPLLFAAIYCWQLRRIRKEAGNEE